MHITWDRLRQLAAGSHAALAEDPAPTVVLGAPQLGEMLAGVVPESFSAEHAAWLPWQQRSELLVRAERASEPVPLRTSLDASWDAVATSLHAGSLFIGLLVTRVPVGRAAPWPQATAQRVSDVLAAELVPLLAGAVRREQAVRDGADLLQLRLERAGDDPAGIATLATDADLPDAHAFHGAVQIDGAGMSYLGRVRNGPSPAGFAPVVMTLLGRWLRDLPEPDPSTVIDAVHTDLIELLSHLEVEVEASVIVPAAGCVRVSTSSTAIAVVRADGTIADRATPDGVTVAGGQLGARRTVELVAPRDGALVAIDGIADPDQLLAIIGTAGSMVGSPLAFAAQLRERAAQQTTLTGSVLVHALT